MTAFVDTSALYALLDGDDRFHALAATAWLELLPSEDQLVTSSYVLVEACALVQRRLGIAAVRDLSDHLLPVLGTEWIGEAEHRTAHAALLASGRRDLSLVDCVSFHVMRKARIRRVFTFDPHFAEQGFEPIPASSSS